jgi:hypothetical protein
MDRIYVYAAIVAGLVCILAIFYLRRSRNGNGKH